MCNETERARGLLPYISRYDKNFTHIQHTWATTRVASESSGKSRLIFSDQADIVNGSSLPMPYTATSLCPASADSSVGKC